jgi:hypothetical protein
MSYNTPNYAIPGLMPVTSPLAELLPLLIRLETYYKANSPWPGIESIGPVLVNDEVPASPAALVVMEFAEDTDFQNICYTLASDASADGTVTIDGDGSTWLFEVPDQDLPLHIGMWHWRLLITAVDESVLKIYGGTLLIQP